MVVLNRVLRKLDYDMLSNGKNLKRQGRKIMRPNCNRCQPTKRCKGVADESKCFNFRAPYDKWMLAEIALAYPASLNEALSNLPFTVNLDFYLRKM